MSNPFLYWTKLNLFLKKSKNSRTFAPPSRLQNRVILPVAGYLIPDEHYYGVDKTSSEYSKTHYLSTESFEKFKDWEKIECGLGTLLEKDLNNLDLTKIRSGVITYLAGFDSLKVIVFPLNYWSFLVSHVRRSDFWRLYIHTTHLEKYIKILGIVHNFKILSSRECKNCKYFFGRVVQNCCSFGTKACVGIYELFKDCADLPDYETFFGKNKYLEPRKCIKVDNRGRYQFLNLSEPESLKQTQEENEKYFSIKADRRRSLMKFRKENCEKCDIDFKKCHYNAETCSGYIQLGFNLMPEWAKIVLLHVGHYSLKAFSNKTLNKLIDYLTYTKNVNQPPAQHVYSAKPVRDINLEGISLVCPYLADKNNCYVVISYINKDTIRAFYHHRRAIIPYDLVKELFYELHLEDTSFIQHEFRFRYSTNLEKALTIALSFHEFAISVSLIYHRISFVDPDDNSLPKIAGSYDLLPEVVIHFYRKLKNEIAHNQ